MTELLVAVYQLWAVASSPFAVQSPIRRQIINGKNDQMETWLFHSISFSLHLFILPEKNKQTMDDWRKGKRVWLSLWRHHSSALSFSQHCVALGSFWLFISIFSSSNISLSLRDEQRTHTANELYIIFLCYSANFFENRVLTKCVASVLVVVIPSSFPFLNRIGLT